MNITLSDLLPLAVAVLSGLAGWLWRKIEGLEKSLAAHRTHVAEKYVTKDDNDKSIDRVYSALERIEKKLDDRRP